MTPPPLLAYRVDGDGDGVLLLNGGMMTIAAWEPLALQLARGHRVIRCDFRGQLLSPGRPPEELGEHAGDVAALLDHLDLGRVHVVGTSFGGQVALLLAATMPDRVASLAVATVVDHVDAAMTSVGTRLEDAARCAAAGDPDPFWRTLGEVVYSAGYVAAHEQELRERQPRITAVAPPSWYGNTARLLEAVEAADLRPHLPRIQCPTLVVLAGDDRLMPLDRGRAVAAAIPGARLEILEGSGHALVVERAEAFSALLSTFLAGVSRRTRNEPKGDRP